MSESGHDAATPPDPTRHNTVLFIGPSTDPAVASARFRGEIRPPVKRGDVDGLLNGLRRPDCIGLVDGVFMQALAVSPKEIVRALDLGVKVFGSSSMGALRAVECSPFGMVGVGRIYELYASGEVDADDEVALTFDPDTSRPLCEPLVNIRFALQAGVDRGVVTAATAATALAAAKSTYFPQRSYRSMLIAITGRVPDAERRALAAYLGSTHAPNQKELDAFALIELINSTGSQPRSQSRPCGRRSSSGTTAFPHIQRRDPA